MEKYYIEPGCMLFRYTGVEKIEMNGGFVSIDGIEILEDPNKILAYLYLNSCDTRKITFLKEEFDKNSYEFESEAEARLLYELK